MSQADVFKRLEPLLIDAIPKAVKAESINQPVCTLRVYYYDTHAPCTYLLLRAMSAQRRAQLLEEKGQSALYYLWAANEEGCDGPEIALDGPPTVAELFAQVYDLLCESEEQHMPPFRALLQRVSLALNRQDWKGACPVTDDFVVIPADGSRFFCDEYNDIASSVPAERLELLRSRERLGPGKDWERLPRDLPASLSEDERLVREIEERAQALPIPARIDYWIQDLDKLAARQPCDSSRIGCNASFALDHLGELGAAAVLPMLRLACKWADTPVWVWPAGVVPSDENAEFGPLKEDVIVRLFWKVRDLGCADRQTELLLREFLQRSCRANAGQPLWSTLPVHCADCLHTLFGRYPQSVMGGSNNELENREQFLQVPLPAP